MNNPGFRPNKLRYLILPTEVKAQETKIEGSQYSIEVAKDPHEKPSEGTVVAVGKDCSEFAVGSIVLYGKYSGYEQNFDRTHYLILAETEILGERLVTPFDEDMNNQQAQYVEPIKVVRMGLGEVVCNWGAYDGFPSVFIEPVSPAGKVGEIAPGDQKTSVVPGALILQFQNPEGAGILVEDINSTLEKFYGENPIK